MGCFRACFSLSKSRKLGKSAIKTSFRDHIKKPAEAVHPADFEPKSGDELEKYPNLDIPLKFAVNSSPPAPQIEIENAQELLATTAKKIVTFDLIIKENAIDPIQNNSAILYPADSEPNTQDELENHTDHSVPIKQDPQQQKHSIGGNTVTFDQAIKAHETESTVEIEKNEKGEEIEEAVEDLLVSKAFPYPASHRYGNCNTNDEENEEREFEENNFDEDDEQNIDQNETVISSESPESLFSLSIDFIRQGSAHEYEEKGQGSVHEYEEKEVNGALKMSDLPDLEAMETDSVNQNDQLSTHCADLVLNPVENLTQWKAAKEKIAQSFDHHQEKENINLDREYKSRERNSKHRIAVDTSLSSWLVESETTPKSKGSDNSIGNHSPLVKGSSGNSFEDRPILGALTMEDLKQFSASPSPIRSRSRSPVETPIIGTVGRYWTHTQEDLKQLSSSSPIQSRSRSPVETPIIGTVGSHWSHTDLVSSSSSRGLKNSARKFGEENTGRQKTPFAARLEKALEGNLAEV